MNRLERAVSIDDVREAARRRVPPAVSDFFDCEAETETTLRRIGLISRHSQSGVACSLTSASATSLSRYSAAGMSHRSAKAGFPGSR